VVLIGDHKQLRPIITNQVVKDLGMEYSLFERHSENAIMLDTQYRMVRRLVAALTRRL
jgi:superfamily I DNA and/or RNA helicase